MYCYLQNLPHTKHYSKTLSSRCIVLKLLSLRRIITRDTGGRACIRGLMTVVAHQKSAAIGWSVLLTLRDKCKTFSNKVLAAAESTFRHHHFVYQGKLFLSLFDIPRTFFAHHRKDAAALRIDFRRMSSNLLFVRVCRFSRNVKPQMPKRHILGKILNHTRWNKRQPRMNGIRLTMKSGRATPIKPNFLVAAS